jgi:hypothetical protein
MHGIESAICRWIYATLESSNISATLSGEILGASVARACPQGGVLSPLLWSLVVDDFISGLNSSGYYTVGYADDIAILIKRKFPHTVSEVLQTALHTVQQWCERTNLSINPYKTVVIPLPGREAQRDLGHQFSSRKQSNYPVKSSTLD